MSVRSDKRVVIVGGGYGGTALARALDDVAEVTLVDRKEAFFHRVASLRAAVDPSWTSMPFIPYDKLLARGRFVRAMATGIDPERQLVTLDAGDPLAYDVAVIATGAEARDPARFVGTTVSEAEAALRIHQQRIAEAPSIVIIGGGPVGVELAGEIRAVHPHKSVALIEDQDSLLPGDHTPELGARAQRRLESQRVTVRLGERLSTNASSANGHHKELILWAVGNRPNNAWLAEDHSRQLTTAGLVHVDDFLRVDGWRNVFAIGDVTDVPESKLVLPAVAQAKTAAANITALLEGSGPLKPHRPSNQKLLVVPIGPADGVTMLPLSKQGTVVGAWPTKKLKSEKLFVPKYRKALGQ